MLSGEIKRTQLTRSAQTCVRILVTFLSVSVPRSGWRTGRAEEEGCVLGIPLLVEKYLDEETGDDVQ
jgi:hypothetical protein